MSTLQNLDSFHQVVRDRSLANFLLVPLHEERLAKLGNDPRIALIRKDLDVFKTESREKLTQLKTLSLRIDDLARSTIQLRKQLGVEGEKKHESSWGPAQLKKIHAEIQTIRKRAEEIANHPSFRRSIEMQLNLLEELLRMPQEEFQQRSWSRKLSLLYPWALGVAAVLLVAQAGFRSYAASNYRSKDFPDEINFWDCFTRHTVDTLCNKLPSTRIVGAAVSAFLGIALGNLIFWSMNHLIQSPVEEPKKS